MLDWIRGNYTDDEIDEVIEYFLIDNYNKDFDNDEELESISDVDYEMIDIEKMEDFLLERAIFIPVDDKTFIISNY